MKKLIVFFLAAAMVLSACAGGPLPSEEPEPKPTAEATAAPTPEPTPSRLNMFDVMSSFVYEAPPSVVLYPQDEEARGYELIMDHPEVTSGLVDAYSDWIQALSEHMEAGYREHYGDDITWTLNQETPDWQMLAAVALVCGTPEELVEKFTTLVSYEVGAHPGEGKHIDFEFALRPKTPQEAFPLSAVKGDPIPSELFTSTYLLTIYDETGEMRENSGALVELSERLTFPFAERYDFNDCWYDDRDGGARRHTGTDILCPEGTPELACVDGTILAAGGGEGTGNYVVLEGADGTQYHYYHMVEVSQLVQPGDTVKRGDPVGLAGNTGNSTANHLHIAVIAPGGVYVNPYPYLIDAE